MPDAFPRTDVGGRPVIYAGRFVDKIPDGGLPGDCLVLSEQDALPHKLSGILDPANALILLDLSTFPFEAMVGDRWDVPIIVVIPSGQDVDSLTTNFGSLLFERLGCSLEGAAPEIPLGRGSTSIGHKRPSERSSHDGLQLTCR